MNDTSTIQMSRKEWTQLRYLTRQGASEEERWLAEFVFDVLAENDSGSMNAVAVLKVMMLRKNGYITDVSFLPSGKYRFLQRLNKQKLLRVMSPTEVVNTLFE